MKGSGRDYTRQGQQKHHPALGSDRRRDGSIVECRELLHDGEPEAGSTGTTASIGDPIVAIKHMREMLGRNARSIISDTDLDALTGRRCRYRHVALRRES